MSSKSGAIKPFVKHAPEASRMSVQRRGSQAGAAHPRLKTSTSFHYERLSVTLTVKMAYALTSKAPKASIYAQHGKETGAATTR